MNMEASLGFNNSFNVSNVDKSRLLFLGFSDMEIDIMFSVLESGNYVTLNKLRKLGLDYNSAKRIKYLYDIYDGRVIIEDMDSLSKHMKKMNPHMVKLSIHNLAINRVKEVPRTAVVAGIPKGTFSIWNSSNYPTLERMYTVVNVTAGKVYIETDRIPVIKYGEPKSIEGILEIKEKKKNGKLVVSIDKEYCRLCNRFIVVASLRRPPLHHGMVEIIALDGTKVYVYAKSIGTRDKVADQMGTQRVYSYGFYPMEIDRKLIECAEEVYAVVYGTYTQNHPANQDFMILTPEDASDEEDNDGIEIE